MAWQRGLRSHARSPPPGVPEEDVAELHPGEHHQRVDPGGGGGGRGQLHLRADLREQGGAADHRAQSDRWGGAADNAGPGGRVPAPRVRGLGWVGLGWVGLGWVVAVPCAFMN